MVEEVSMAWFGGLSCAIANCPHPIESDFDRVVAATKRLGEGNAKTTSRKKKS